MTKRTAFQVAITAALVVLPACSLQYNSTLGPSQSGDSRHEREYRKFKEELAQQRAVQPSRPAGAYVPGSWMSLPGTTLISTAPGETGTSSPILTEPQFISDGPRRRSLTPLGLYGQLPTAQASVASPLDSPDNVIQVTFATEGADFDPAIDPSGQWLAYASTQHRATADIYIKRVDGTAITQLTSDPANDVMPTFSPDGKYIAFCSDRSGTWDIYLMEVTGGQTIKLTDGPTHDLHPSFSPNGKQLVYCSYGAQSGQWELVVIDIDNPSQKRYIAHGLFPSWSPVDNRIVFQRARERGTRWFSIWTVELEGGQAVRPTEILSSTNAAVITPDWSPDGKHLVFCTVIDPSADETIRPTQADVWVVAADGTGRSNLTRSRFANLQPVWSPDGTIYFVSNRGKYGQENIWAIRPDAALRVAAGAKKAKEATATVPTDRE